MHPLQTPQVYSRTHSAFPNSFPTLNSQNMLTPQFRMNPPNFNSHPYSNRKYLHPQENQPFPFNQRGGSFSKPQVYQVGQPILLTTNNNPYQSGNNRHRFQEYQKVNSSLDIFQDKVYCVICSQHYLASQIHEHLSKHQRKHKDPQQFQRVQEMIQNYNIDEQPKAPVIVQPEQFNIQYKPNKYVLDYKKTFETQKTKTIIVQNQCVGTDDLPTKKSRKKFDDENKNQELAPDLTRQAQYQRQPVRISNQQNARISQYQKNNYRNSRRPQNNIMPNSQQDKNQYHPQQVSLQNEQQRISSQNYNDYRNQRNPANTNSLRQQPYIISSTQQKSKVSNYQGQQQKKQDIQNLSNTGAIVSQINTIDNNQRLARQTYANENEIEPTRFSNIGNRQTIISNHNPKQQDNMSYNKKIQNGNSSIQKNNYHKSSISKQGYRPSYISSQQQSRVNLKEGDLDESQYNSNYQGNNYRQSSVMNRSYQPDDYSRNSSQQQAPQQPSRVNLKEGDLDESQYNSNYQGNNYRQSSVMNRSYQPDDYSRNSSQQQAPQQPSRVNLKEGDLDQSQYNSNYQGNNYRQSSVMNRSYQPDDYSRNSSQQQAPQQPSRVNLYDQKFIQSQYQGNNYRQSSINNRNYQSNKYYIQNKQNPNFTNLGSKNSGILIGNQDQMNQRFTYQNYRNSSISNRNYDSRNIQSKRMNMPQENIQKIHFDNQLEQNYQQQSFARGSSLIHRKYNEDDYNKKSQRQIEEQRLRNQVINFENERERQQLPDTRKVIGLSNKSRKFSRSNQNVNSEGLISEIRPNDSNINNNSHSIHRNEQPSIKVIDEHQNIRHKQQFSQSFHNQNVPKLHHTDSNQYKQQRREADIKNSVNNSQDQRNSSILSPSNNNQIEENHVRQSKNSNAYNTNVQNKKDERQNYDNRAQNSSKPISNINQSQNQSQQIRQANQPTKKKKLPKFLTNLWN